MCRKLVTMRNITNITSNKMETCRPCGCKGIRTCLLCEKEFDIKRTDQVDKTNGTYVYCPFCNQSWEGWDQTEYKDHPNHKGKSFDYPGVYIKLDFLTVEEEQRLLDGIANEPWQLSQSGRRKQNYGPKCNFRKNKLQTGDFTGFPAFTQFVQEKFKTLDILSDFQTIEQCSLEYNPDRGASIDAHIDDCWIWGERIVTVNLEADSVLTMTYNSKPTKYNLDLVGTYPAVLDKTGLRNRSNKSFVVRNNLDIPWPVVRIPMPRRSLLVMYGSARYDWEHQILREDLPEKRICIAYREFTPTYLSGGKSYEKGKPILEIAKNFIPA